MLGYSDAKRWFATGVDRWLGISAGRDEVLAATGAPTDDGMPKGYVSYVPSNYVNLWWALRGRTGRNDVFVDLGCGAGRAVCFAARTTRMKRCMGVEYTPALATLAERNAAAVAARTETPVEIVCADATQWTVPDDVTVVYLFNPFMDEVFEGALARLLESIDRAPRTVTVIYSFPTQRDRLLATGRARLVATLKGRRSDPEKALTLTTEIYELT